MEAKPRKEWLQQLAKDCPNMCEFTIEEERSTLMATGLWYDRNGELQGYDRNYVTWEVECSCGKVWRIHTHSNDPIEIEDITDERNE